MPPKSFTLPKISIFKKHFYLVINCWSGVNKKETATKNFELKYTLKFVLFSDTLVLQI